jgi:tRNA G37 N-methylase TrmD
MTIEEIEDVVRALTTVMDNLETSSARQSMQEAFLQVRAYARSMRASGKVRPPRRRQAEV